LKIREFALQLLLYRAVDGSRGGYCLANPISLQVIIRREGIKKREKRNQDVLLQRIRARNMFY
jgi:hypothetical protein